MKKHALAGFLKQKREAKGLTQADVSAKLGYTSPQFVSNWERGVSCPPVPVLKRLTNLYSASLNDFHKLVLEMTLEQTKEDLQVKFFGKRK